MSDNFKNLESNRYVFNNFMCQFRGSHVCSSDCHLGCSSTCENYSFVYECEICENTGTSECDTCVYAEK